MNRVRILSRNGIFVRSTSSAIRSRFYIIDNIFPTVGLSSLTKLMTTASSYEAKLASLGKAIIWPDISELSFVGYMVALMLDSSLTSKQSPTRISLIPLLTSNFFISDAIFSTILAKPARPIAIASYSYLIFELFILSLPR